MFALWGPGLCETFNEDCINKILDFLITKHLMVQDLMMKMIVLPTNTIIKQKMESIVLSFTLRDTEQKLLRIGIT